MNATFLLAASPWDIGGWTMLHFMWVGCLVGMIGVALRYAVRRVGPRTCYAVSLGTLLALAIAPLAIVAQLRPLLPTDNAAVLRDDSNHTLVPPRLDTDLVQSPVPAAPLSELAVVELSDAAPGSLAVSSGATTSELVELPSEILAQAGPPTDQRVVASKPSAPRPFGDWAAQIAGVAAPYLPWVWLAGAPFTFLTTAVGLAGAGRLRRESRPLMDGPQRAACDRIAQAMGIGRRVGLSVCDRCVQPLLIGIVRPLILLPPAAINGLTTDELEMVLWHELAHVRRWDNLVNLLQRIVEATLFFHPVVWFVSRQVRRDREECCDAVVVARTAQPQAYAALLVRFAAPIYGRLAPNGASLAGHPLRQRIRRILRIPAEPLRLSRWAVVTGLASLALMPWGLKFMDDLAVGRHGLGSIASAEGTRYADPDARAHEDAVARGIVWLQDQQGTERARQDAATVPAAEANDVPSLKRLPSDAPFLSLEDHRAAALAYRILGVDLEPLDEKELERVKKLKFAGGLRVSLVGSTTTGGIVSHTLMPGDLLVGLHAWATTSHQRVAQVLERDDLLDLSPLKFYVVRAESSEHQMMGMRGGGFGREGRSFDGGAISSGPEPEKTEDRLVTGRIDVNEQAVRQWRERARGIVPTVPSLGLPTRLPSYPNQPNLQSRIYLPTPSYPTPPNFPRVESGGPFNSSPPSGPGQPPTLNVGPPVSGNWVQRNTALTEAREIGNEGSPESEPGADSIRPATAPQIGAPMEQHSEPNSAERENGTWETQSSERVPTLHPAGEDRRDTDAPGEDRRATDAPGEDRRATDIPGEDRRATEDRRVTYRFDGQTFEHWRDMWQLELSDEKRIVALRALTAFGRTDRANEVAASILEIAGQYDWLSPEVGDSKTVMLACISAFGTHGGDQQSLPAEAFRTALIAAMRSGHRQQQLFCTYVVDPFLEGEVVDIWLSWTQSDDAPLRRAAIANPRFVAGTFPTRDPRVEQRYRDLIEDASEAGDAQTVAVALEHLPSTAQNLLHPLLARDKAVQDVARNRLSSSGLDRAINENRAARRELTTKLLAAAQEGDDAALGAIRALGRMVRSITPEGVSKEGMEMATALEAILEKEDVQEILTGNDEVARRKVASTFLLLAFLRGEQIEAWVHAFMAACAEANQKNYDDHFQSLEGKADRTLVTEELAILRQR